MFDLGLIDEPELRTHLEPLLQIPAQKPGSSSGNFYTTLESRVSTPFALAMVTGVLEGRIPYPSALRALGFKKLSAFDELARRLKVIA